MPAKRCQTPMSSCWGLTAVACDSVMIDFGRCGQWSSCSVVSLDPLWNCSAEQKLPGLNLRQLGILSSLTSWGTLRTCEQDSRQLRPQCRSEIQRDQPSASWIRQGPGCSTAWTPEHTCTERQHPNGKRSWEVIPSAASDWWERHRCRWRLCSTSSLTLSRLHWSTHFDSR